MTAAPGTHEHHKSHLRRIGDVVSDDDTHADTDDWRDSDAHACTQAIPRRMHACVLGCMSSNSRRLERLSLFNVNVFWKELRLDYGKPGRATS